MALLYLFYRNSKEGYHPSASNNAKYFVKRYLTQKDGKILDIGSYDVNGNMRQDMPKQYEYVGMDIEKGPNVDIVSEDPYKYPFPDNTFDAVISSSCFEHDNMFWLTFLEMLRVCKKDGYIYINAPSQGPYHAHPGDNWRFYKDAGKALVKWAEREGKNVILIESYHGLKDKDGKLGEGDHMWKDFVAIFKKV